MRRRSATATAISPTTFLRLYPAARLQGEHPRDDARRALRLDRRAAGAQADRARPAGLSLSVRSRLSGDGRRRAARLPRQRIAVSCSARTTARRRSGRRCPTPQPNAPCPTRCSIIGPASRATGRPASANAAGVARLWIGAGAICTSPIRRVAETKLMPGMYALNEAVMCRKASRRDRRGTGTSALPRRSCRQGRRVRVIG